MPKKDRDGRTVRLSLSRLLSRPVRDADIALALDMPVSSYSRRKDKPDFPTFDELRQVAERLGVDETVLLIDFGYLDVEHLNRDLQERYAAYRNAIDIIASMRREPGRNGTLTETLAPEIASAQRAVGDGRPPRLAEARPIRSL